MCEQIIRQICPKTEELSIVRTSFTCTQEGCNSVFKTSSNLEMHLIKTHNKSSLFLKKRDANVKFQYFCPVLECKYSLKGNESQPKCFPNLKYLKQHYLKVHKEKEFTCNACDKSFPTESQMNHHKGFECGRVFFCASCPFFYTNYGGLLMHCRRKGHVLVKSHPPPQKVTSPRSNAFPQLPPVVRTKEKFILPKPADESSVDIAAVALSELSRKVIVKGVDKAVQTAGRKRLQVKALKKKSSRETQTEHKQPRISSETQTTGFYSGKAPRVRRNRRKSMQTQTKQGSASEECIFPVSSDLDDPDLKDFVLSPLWAARSSSSTQTTSNQSAYDKSLNLDLFNDSFKFETSSNFTGEPISEEQISRLIQQNTIFDYSRLCDIETQTTENDDFVDDYPIFSNNETQTIQDPIDEYSHNCTQTCDDILLSDFVEFSDIETQTAWAYLRGDYPLVSAETQTAS